MFTFNLFDWFTNTFENYNRYKASSDAVIISCFFNPQNSPYRLLAFQKFYRSIKHLNHRIIECVIGDALPQLPESPYITRVHSDTLLWHKEALLNKLIRELPREYKYVFWVDADLKFLNQNWMVDAVKVLQTKKICQLFEYCVHLKQNQTEIDDESRLVRSFCANFVSSPNLASNARYELHGHVGFAWGARREVLDQIPLYDHALIGGADHVMAHAAAGHIPHECITKSFTDDIEDVEDWMQAFYEVVQGSIGFVPGYVLHYWHGDTKKRRYLKRIQDFTRISKEIQKKDENGLYVKPNDKYVEEYFQDREVVYDDIDFQGFDEGFIEDMGYWIEDIVYEGDFYEERVDDYPCEEGEVEFSDDGRPDCEDDFS